MPIMSFDDALQASTAGRRNLLLGNGFSISLRPDIFRYASLFEKADFSNLPAAKKLFEAAETYDFEVVIKNLIFTRRALRAFRGEARLIERIDEYVEALKDILVDTIGRNHPDLPQSIEGGNYSSVRQFISNFNKIYTLNYDLLLYWAMQQSELDELDFPLNDGFLSPEDVENESYCQWIPGKFDQEMYHIHGALHIFDSNRAILKYTYSRTDIPLMTQMRTALDEGKYPLYVAEGDSSDKLRKILHNSYLSRCYESFVRSQDTNTKGSLFVFGHSLAENDDHILRAIKNGKVRSLFVSLKRGLPENADIERRAHSLAQQRSRRFPLQVFFFDADSAHVWG